MPKIVKYTAAERRKFAEIYVRTGNASEAWGQTFPVRAEKLPRKKWSWEAHKLLQKPEFRDAVERAALGADVGRCVSKARLCEILTDVIEASARDGTVERKAKLIDILCRMNGFYEAQKIDVRHGAIDDDSRNRALQALRDAGADVIDARVIDDDEDADDAVDNPLLGAPMDTVIEDGHAVRPAMPRCRPSHERDDIQWAIDGAKVRFPRIEGAELNCDGGGLLS